MRRALLLALLAMGGGGALGWVSAPQAEAPETARARIMPALSHGGAEAGAVRQRVREFGFGAFDAPEAEIAAPQPPDIAVLFRRDLTAIEQRSEGRVALVVDFTQDFGRRALKVGDVYRDGWRVAGIGWQTIELRRRGERRSIAVFDPPREGEP